MVYRGTVCTTWKRKRRLKIGLANTARKKGALYSSTEFSKLDDPLIFLQLSAVCFGPTEKARWSEKWMVKDRYREVSLLICSANYR